MPEHSRAHGISCPPASGTPREVGFTRVACGDHDTDHTQDRIGTVAALVYGRVRARLPDRRSYDHPHGHLCLHLVNASVFIRDWRCV